jgi:hypothetical protein
LFFDKVQKLHLDRCDIISILKQKIDAASVVGRHLGPLFSELTELGCSLSLPSHLELDVVARCSVALFSVRIGWPLLVIEGSGHSADELSAAVRDAKTATFRCVEDFLRKAFLM